MEWIVDGMVDDPFGWAVVDALDAWRPLVEGQPRIARAAWTWTAPAGGPEVVSRLAKGT